MKGKSSDLSTFAQFAAFQRDESEWPRLLRARELVWPSRRLHCATLQALNMLSTTLAYRSSIPASAAWLVLGNIAKADESQLTKNQIYQQPQHNFSSDPKRQRTLRSRRARCLCGFSLLRRRTSDASPRPGIDGMHQSQARQPKQGSPDALIPWIKSTVPQWHKRLPRLMPR